MAKKGPMPNFETIDDYINYQPIHAQEKLKQIRNLIHEIVPDVKEKLNYKIPSFNLVGSNKLDHQIMMAAYAKFIGFYPFPGTIEAFKEKLKNYKLGKGSIQFPYSVELPTALIKEMILFRAKEIKNHI